MIRANLVPPENRGTLLFGVRLERADFVLFGAAIAAAVLPALLIWGCYGLAIGNANARLATLDQRLAQMASTTNDVGQLASDVQRLKEIGDDAAWLKRNGQVLALRLAYLGNAAPAGVWFDHIGHERNGWQIDGGGTNLEAMGRFLKGAAATSPGLQTGFTSVTGSDSSSVLTFKATITTPSPTPQPSAAVGAAHD